MAKLNGKVNEKGQYIMIENTFVYKCPLNNNNTKKEGLMTK